MKSVLPSNVEAGRVKHGIMASDASYGLVGAFIIQGPSGRKLTILSSGDDKEYGWQHVSVSTERRIPNWEEMCFVKDLFWDDDECVVQFHPPKSQYVNCYPNCLHLWKRVGSDFELPPSMLVGPRQ